MSTHRPLGPEKPRPLITIRHAREDGSYLWVYCARCDRGVNLTGLDIPASLDRRLTLGEVWLHGRFRCGQCRRAAASIAYSERINVQARETWSLDQPFVAERLRRYWRWTVPR